MKIGIIVHSLTGNTQCVAQRLQAALSRRGHEACVVRLSVAGGEDPQRRDFTLQNPPSTAPYDGLVFGAPVRGFSVSPVIHAYLKQMEPLDGRPVACFITKHLNNNWTGGRRALTIMRRDCAEKGGRMVGDATVFWNSRQREEDIDRLTEQLGDLF